MLLILDLAEMGQNKVGLIGHSQSLRIFHFPPFQAPPNPLITHPTIHLPSTRECSHLKYLIPFPSRQPPAPNRLPLFPSPAQNAQRLSFVALNIKIMIQQKLGSEWGVWCLYEGSREQNLEVNYDKNLELVFSLETMTELAYVWSNTSFSNLGNFLSNPKTGLVKKYVVAGEPARKIEALCFFRKGIMPTWQDPQNKKGGQFTFFVPRDQLDTTPIYQSLVFGLAGDLLPMSSYVNGIRFVDKYNEKRGESSVKVEIWVRFQDKDRALVDPFFSDFLEFIKSNNLGISKVEFKNF